MSLGRIYTVDSGLITLASTSQTCILEGTTGSTNTVDIQAIRISLASGSGVSYPSNGTVQCQLARASSVSGGSSALTPSPHNSGDVGAQSVWKSGSTAITATEGAVLWNQNLPFTAGANWAEWVTPGDEWRVPISSSVGFFLTCSSAGTATEFQVELVFAE